ncbi:hypothetical protein [Marinobacter salarius]|uniref:Uncharacterized protein n=1 Tax=Marinobacter salarius TaxID=1420917 RepID=A0A1W6KFG1_9GAMM|nr:hypothetical protein [Marinobacter salarius]ARM86147.1 hypothetical protein MARSALSMR5_04127 [Marinobacter salarius]
MATSTITFKTYFDFPGRVPPAKVSIEGPPDVFLSGTDVRLPKRGITGIYGTIRSQYISSQLVNRSLRQGQEPCFVSASIEVDGHNTAKFDVNELGQRTFLSLPDVTRANLKDAIRSAWVEILDHHGRCSMADQFPRRPSPNMDLLDDLVNRSPFSTLKAIAYPIITEVGEIMMLTVFDRNAVTTAAAMTLHPVTINLAGWSFKNGFRQSCH